MAGGHRVYRGRVYDDPHGYNYEPRSWWDTDPLLEIKPWKDLALFWKYLIHLAVWEWEGREVWRKGDAAPVRVKRGQLYVSLRELGKKPGWSPSKVARALELFEKDGRAVTESRSRGTLITLVNYETYQDPDFYRGTHSQVGSGQKGQKCDGNRDGDWDTTEDLFSSRVRTRCKRGPGTRSETGSGTVTEQTRDGNIVKTGKTLNLPAGDRDRAKLSTPLSTFPQEPDRTPCTWHTIAHAISNELWPRIPDNVKPCLIAEASTFGPPPAEIDSRLRDALIREAARHGISLPSSEAMPE